MPSAVWRPASSTGETLIDCKQVYQTGTSYNPRCLGLHGPINVQYALMVSCNYFFYESGTRQGIDNIVKYSNQLGLGTKTGIELSEATGHVSSPEYYESVRQGQVDDTWTYGNVLQSAIGQLDNAFTPLQMANYVATLGNYGVRNQVSIVKGIEGIGETEKDDPYTIDVEKEDMEKVIEGMRRVVKNGTLSGIFAGLSLIHI